MTIDLSLLIRCPPILGAIFGRDTQKEEQEDTKETNQTEKSEETQAETKKEEESKTEKAVAPLMTDNATIQALSRRIAIEASIVKYVEPMMTLTCICNGNESDRRRLGLQQSGDDDLIRFTLLDDHDLSTWRHHIIMGVCPDCSTIHTRYCSDGDEECDEMEMIYAHLMRGNSDEELRSSLMLVDKEVHHRQKTLKDVINFATKITMLSDFRMQK